MLGYKKDTCPLLRGPCIEEKCKFWTHLMGKNPQTDGTIDKFGCAIEFLPVLLVENAQMVRQNTATTDKVASEVRKQSETIAFGIELSQRNGSRTPGIENQHT